MQPERGSVVSASVGPFERLILMLRRRSSRILHRRCAARRLRLGSDGELTTADWLLPSTEAVIAPLLAMTLTLVRWRAQAESPAHGMRPKVDGYAKLYRLVLGEGPTGESRSYRVLEGAKAPTARSSPVPARSGILTLHALVQHRLWG